MPAIPRAFFVIHVSSQSVILVASLDHHSESTMKYSNSTILWFNICTLLFLPFGSTSYSQDNASSQKLKPAGVSSPKFAVIAADNGRIMRYDKAGNVVWSMREGIQGIHKIQQLENGNIICQMGWQKLVEITPDKKIAWSYDSSKRNGNEGKRLEVHAFQRLKNGNTMIVENGIGRIIEVDPAGKLVHEVKYTVEKPNAHSDVRMGSKLSNGNYLLCFEAEGRVTEIDDKGNIVWNYPVPMFGKKPAGGHGLEAFGNKVYNAVRLPNGNTLIATGNGHSILEVTPKKEIVWKLEQNDLPNISLAWVTSLEVLPNGNLIIGNCHAGLKNPQLIEVDRNKNVIWTFRDFNNLGNSTAASATVGVKEILR